jgi:hypothetical protein
MDRSVALGEEFAGAVEHGWVGALLFDARPSLADPDTWQCSS